MGNSIIVQFSLYLYNLDLHIFERYIALVLSSLPMSFVNKLDPSSAAFVPDPTNQSDSISNYMNFFGTDFSAGFPDLAMNMNVEPSAPESHPQKHAHVPSEDPACQHQHDYSAAFNTPGITLEKVQMDMYIAFNSFMQLQSEYQAKLQCVER